MHLKKTTPKLTGLKQFIVIIFYTTVGQTFGQDAAGMAHACSVIWSFGWDESNS